MRVRRNLADGGVRERWRHFIFDYTPKGIANGGGVNRNAARMTAEAKRIRQCLDEVYAVVIGGTIGGGENQVGERFAEAAAGDLKFRDRG